MAMTGAKLDDGFRKDSTHPKLLPFDPRRAMMVRMVDLQRSFAAEAGSKQPG